MSYRDPERSNESEVYNVGKKKSSNAKFLVIGCAILAFLFLSLVAVILLFLAFFTISESSEEEPIRLSVESNLN